MLESELQLFPFHFVLYRVIMFSFDLPGIGLQTFFHAFFFIRLSQYYVCDHEICESTWFNWDSFLLWFFFLVSPFIIGFFNIPYGSRSGSFNLFYYYFLVSFFYCCCVFLFILFKLPIRSITRVLILFS